VESRRHASTRRCSARTGRGGRRPARQPRAPRAAEPDRRAFVAPFFPCADQSGVAGGTIEVPSHLIAHGQPWLLLLPDGPFAGLRDLFAIDEILETERGIRVWSIHREVPRYARVDAIRAVGAGTEERR
jgi:hypothetical protein